MGGTVSCCMSPRGTPKVHRRRREVVLDECPVTAVTTTTTTKEVDVSEDTGTYLQHISDREMPDELAQEANPSDHPRASTLFLNKSQTDVREKRKSHILNHHTSPRLLTKKSSSCSTIFIDDSTVSQPNLKSTVKCGTLAVYYHIKNRFQPYSDIFDEKKHPLTREKVPEDYATTDPEHKLIYRFVRTLFSSAQLTAECAIITHSTFIRRKSALCVSLTRTRVTMEAGADSQQSETTVTEAEAQQIATLAQASIAAGQVTTTGSTVMLVQLPNGQTVQVHAVIQAAQPSVIQSPQIQTVQISTVGESEDSQESVDSVTDSQKRREILSRRPSYRKILNDLSSDAPAVPRIEEEKSEDDTAPAITTVTMPTPIYQTSSGQYIAITQGGAIQLANNGTDGLLTMNAATQPGTTILQYAQTSDGQQILVPSNQVVVQGMIDRADMSKHSPAASGDVQAYQIRTASASTLAPGVVMAWSPALPASGGTEEVTRKREVRLMKNSEAARECRRKKKEYVKCLENRVVVLENQNKTLIEELKALKDLYCHKTE